MNTQSNNEWRELIPKQLDLSYDEYKKRGKTIQNLIIDKYSVLNQIGKGTYGVVYQGINDETKEKVALKIIDLVQIRKQPNQMVRSIKQRLCKTQPELMYICDSEHVIKCYDVYQNQDLKLLVLQYCNGPTLQEEIDNRKRIPQNEAKLILRHLINGIMQLHKHKIVHRDLKANNIMSHKKIYKIIDFGFSKKLQIQNQTKQVKNTSLGTITTMAPEVMSRKNYGLKADIWSIGIIFFQMLYGIQPYTSLSAYNMYKQIQQKKLFHNQKILTINKFAPSAAAYEFLRFIIVVETDKRPGWSQVLNHPYLNSQQNIDLNQQFIAPVEMSLEYNCLDCDININEEDVIRRVKKPIQNKDMKKQLKQQRVSQINVEAKKENIEPKQQTKKQQNIKKQQIQEKQVKKATHMKYSLQELMQIQQIKNKQNIQKCLQINKKSQKKQKTVRQLNKKQIQQKLKQFKLDEQDQYNITQIIHLQCAKTKLIYNQIITQLQSLKIFSNKDRTYIQFLYLLIARCYNNMSPLQDIIQQKKQKNCPTKLLNELKRQITPLYKSVQQKFNYISSRLTQIQNQRLSILKDRVSKIKNFFQSQNKFKIKQNFLLGLEKVDYTKQQQIQFTQKYYEQNIAKKLKQSNGLLKIMRRMPKYKKINLISRQQLKKQKIDFNSKVKSICND